MYEIVRFDRPADKVLDLDVMAPVIAKKRKAGQFVLIRLNEKGERIPLTIADSDPEKGTIRLIVQEVGKTTYNLGQMKVGDCLADVAGPLGQPTHIDKFGTVVCIGGGIGIAPVHPIAKTLKEAGNRIITIIGARSKDLIILEKEMKAISDRVIIATDDGTRGVHGFVTDALQGLINDGVTIDLVVAIGPVPMMKFTSLLTKKYNLPTVVSLNSVMVDGTGMCGGCRVSIGDKSAFVCVDGPEFDGHQVNYDELIMRQSAYIDMEKEALDHYHKCRLDVEAERLKKEAE